MLDVREADLAHLNLVHQSLKRVLHLRELRVRHFNSPAFLTPHRSECSPRF